MTRAVSFIIPVKKTALTISSAFRAQAVAMIKWIIEGTAISIVSAIMLALIKACSAPTDAVNMGNGAGLF